MTITTKGQNPKTYIT